MVVGALGLIIISMFFWSSWGGGFGGSGGYSRQRRVTR